MVKVTGMHVGVKAREPEKMAEFYRNVFDLKESNRVGPLLFVGDETEDGEGEHHRLVFERTPNPVDVSTVNQISLKVDTEHDFLEAKELLESRGVVIEAGPFLHSKHPADSQSLSMYFRDPEGYWIECYVPKQCLRKDIEDVYPICPW